MMIDKSLSNIRCYKSDFAFLNKSYAKDLDWSLVLYGSYERYVQGQFDFYIVVPNSDVALFQEKINAWLDSGKICRSPIILSEEYVLSAAEINDGSINGMSGWEVQQIVKLAFSHTNLAKNYVTIDSAAIFARNFNPTTVWLDRSGTPKTFALGISKNERLDQYFISGEQGWLKGQLVNIATVFDEIDSIMGHIGNETNFYTGFGCFSSDVIYIMMDFLKSKGFANIAEIIRYAPYEYTWYGAFIFSQHPVGFVPMGYIFAPIVSSTDIKSINTFHLSKSQFYGFLFQPPVVDDYSAIELEKIVSDRTELFRAGDSYLHTLVGKFQIQTTGQEGFLVYGPYTELDPASYQISIFGQGTHWTGEEWLDVVCNYNHERHELLRVNFVVHAPGFWRVEHSIKIETACTGLEIRVWVATDSMISVEGIEIKQSALIDT